MTNQRICPFDYTLYYYDKENRIDIEVVFLHDDYVRIAETALYVIQFSHRQDDRLERLS